jgi:hypothetical protein
MSLRTLSLALITVSSFALSSAALAVDNCPPHGLAGVRTIGGRGGVGAGCLPHDASCPDLFYNFYAMPSCGGVPAELYPAPYPTPPLVGHTYYTYQPLMPHEMLYRHTRVYRQYYNYGRGMNRTTVHWW